MPAPAAGTVANDPADAILELDALIDAGAVSEAEIKIGPLMHIYPDDAGLQFLRGRIARKRGDDRAAAAFFERAITLRPESAAAYIELARLHVAHREPARALACYHAALQVAPGIAGLHNNIGLLHLEAGRLHEAEQCFEKALQLQPESAVTKNNLGRVYNERRQYDQAVACFRAALAIDPGDFHAGINLGLALGELGEREQALAQLQACHRAAPRHTEILCGLGKTSFELRRMDDALRYFRGAIAVDGECAGAHFGLANIALLEGDFAAGWEAYEWRMRIANIAQYYAAREPRWDDESMCGKILLVNAEQGYGDVLLFVRFLRRVAESGATVLFRCRPALVRLLREVRGIHRVIDAEAGETVTADASIPLLSLGHALGVGRSDLPGPIPYLNGSQRLADAWRAKLPDRTGLRVGLAWRGNPLREFPRDRIPSAADYRALATVRDADFYNLSVGGSAEDAERFPLPLIDLTSGIADFADTAALVANLDLVITIDTSVAHLCGALGRPTWLLYSGVPDWRWEIAGAESPWYPTVRLFRRGPNGWAETLVGMAQALRTMARDKPATRQGN